jgi:8-oxo-dGTP pyrophosphatase MutT (NUDIX family)
LREDLLTRLEKYEAFDQTEAVHLAEIKNFISKSVNIFSRELNTHHITASAIGVTFPRRDILLVWHNKLGRWLQPGGHVEPNVDATVKDAAHREFLEETGIPPCELLKNPSIFDVDVHDIPVGRCRRHYDVRFLYKVSREFENLTRSDLKWISAHEIAGTYPESLARFARKVLNTYLE